MTLKKIYHQAHNFLYKKFILERAIDQDDNYWVKKDGTIEGPFAHGHVGYILKVAIPQHEINVSPQEANHIAELRKRGETTESWNYVFREGWVRLRKRKDNSEFDINYTSQSSPQAKKAAIDFVFKEINKNTNYVFINNQVYNRDDFFNKF